MTKPFQENGEKWVFTKLDNLENRIEELTHLLTNLMKNQNPFLFTQEPQIRPQANKRSSFFKEPANAVREAPLSTSHNHPPPQDIPKSPKLDPKPSDPPLFQIISRRVQSQRNTRRISRKRIEYSHLYRKIFLSCARKGIISFSRSYLRRGPQSRTDLT